MSTRTQSIVAGLDPASEDLARIAKLETHEDVARLVASPEFRANSPVGIGVGLDAKRPDVYIVGIGQSGLGMPDRDYYLKTDVKFADARAKYRAYIETMLRLGGIADAAASADAIFALETRIAELHWPREKSRNRDLTYNPKSRAELESFAPEFPWAMGLESFGAAGQDFFVVAQTDAVRGLAKLFRETPITTWRAYLTFHYLNSMADVLPKPFDDAAFDFNGRAITGQPTAARSLEARRPRDERCDSGADGRGGGPALHRAQLHAAGEGRRWRSSSRTCARRTGSASTSYRG